MDTMIRYCNDILRGCFMLKKSPSDTFEKLFAFVHGSFIFKEVVLRENVFFVFNETIDDVAVVKQMDVITRRTFKSHQFSEITVSVLKSLMDFLTVRFLGTVMQCHKCRTREIFWTSACNKLL